MCYLPEQRLAASPNLQRENLIYVSFFQLYSSMMRLMRKNYDIRDEDCYKPVPPNVLAIIDNQYESLKSITSYDLNARPVEDRVYAWQVYDVDPIYSTSLFLINELEYIELALLALEHPLIYRTNEEWLPHIGEAKLEEYIDTGAGWYLVPPKLLEGHDSSALQDWYNRKIGQTLLNTTFTEYFCYKFGQRLGYPDKHPVNILTKDLTKQRILINILKPVHPVTGHHPLYDELLITYDLEMDERLERVLDIALNYEAWIEKNKPYPWLLSLYCACLDLFTPQVTNPNTDCKFHCESPKKIHAVVRDYIKSDIACTAKERVDSLERFLRETSSL